MNKIGHFCALLFFIPLITGCASELSARAHLAAEPLQIKPETLVGITSNKKTYVGSIAFDSAAKCDNFIATLTADQSSLNTSTSIGSTILTAIGTAVTPIRTAHAFSAAATVTSSSRDAINSNLYNKGTFAAFHSALQSTYYKSLNNYLDALSATDESQIDVGVEITKVQTIHATCSLAAAESSILATIQPPQPNETGAGGSAPGAPAAGAAPAGAAPAPAPAPAAGAAVAPAPGAAGASGTGSKTKGAVAGARIW